MAKGQYSSSKFMDSIINYSKFLIEEARKGKVMEFKKEERPQKRPFGKCPACGGAVYETAMGWSCSKWRETGCKFTIWKEDKGLANFGKKVTATMAKSLLKNGRAQAKGLISPKTKEKFDNDVILVNENGYWNIKVDFGNNSNTANSADNQGDKSTNRDTKNSITPTEYICPVCKTGHLIHTVSDKFQGWGCERWKEGCKFSIPAEKCGIKLDAYLEQIVTKGQTDIIENFKSQKGNTFTAKLVVKDGKLDMEFVDKR